MSLQSINRWIVCLFAFTCMSLVAYCHEPFTSEQPDVVEAKNVASHDLSKILAWRSIGPSNMGGRITALAVFDGDPSTYVATASGGCSRRPTTAPRLTISSIAKTPCRSGLLSRRRMQHRKVGTGEANPRNSVSYGDGVYLSTDGGNHWKNRG